MRVSFVRQGQIMYQSRIVLPRHALPRTLASTRAHIIPLSAVPSVYLSS